MIVTLAWGLEVNWKRAGILLPEPGVLPTLGSEIGHIPQLPIDNEPSLEKHLIPTVSSSKIMISSDLSSKYKNNQIISNKKVILDINNANSNVLNIENEENNNYENINKNNKSEEIDSKENLILRCTDLFCGFISKMMRAMYEDTKTNDNEKSYYIKHQNYS